MAVELTESLLAKLAGWEAVKLARNLLAGGKVLSSNWTAPVLRGVVQEGTVSYRAGLVLKSERDVENICTCRQAREWGTICSHSVAVGLHHLKPATAALPEDDAVSASSGSRASPPGRPRPAGKRIVRTSAEIEGEPAEIFVILPPSLGPAVQRGKVMLCFEGAWRGGRVPLNALPASKSFQFSAQDAALLDAIETLAGGETPAMMMIGTRDFSELLHCLIGHSRITFGKSVAVQVLKEPSSVSLQASLQANGEILLTLAQSGAATLVIANKWLLHDGVVQPLALPESCLGVFQGPVRLPRSAVPRFLSRDWPRLQLVPGARANFKAEDFVLQPQTPRFSCHLVGGLAQLEARVQCTYGHRVLTLGVNAPENDFWLPDPASPMNYGARDLTAERAALARLLRAGFSAPDEQGRCRLHGQDRVLSFFAREYPRLQKEWTLTLEGRLDRSVAQKTERIEPRFEITSSGVQWFDLSVSFASGDGERLSAAEIQRLLLSGQSHTQLRSGRLALIDTGAVEELQEVLLDCAPDQVEGRYRMNQAQAGFVGATLRAQGWTASAPAAWRERLRQQTGEARPPCPPLGDLEDVLRPYQKEGVAWLWFLRQNGFGGILADEMGLGKTLQILALLQCLRELSAGAAGRPDAAPMLVVCPTSLVFNWLNEAKRFTPRLRVLALQGGDRHEFLAHIPQSDLVVTSYALIRRDLERYQQFAFDTVVLDEAQHIKNRQTQNAQAVKAVRARHRLVLTGTPLENSVLDLWSISDFLMPGYLGSAKDFRERYELPIARDRNTDAQARLARRLRPFLLRRMKSEVASELPPKIEQVAYCELSETQRSVYQQIMESGRSEMLAAAGQGIGRGRIVALNALLRLRQACCDLRLLKLDGAVAGATSGKLELFGELIEEALDGGHRVLVFSQFVSMLTLLREKLAAEAVEYCYLDGSISNRAEVVLRFQETQTPVFLISLKAGGVGLNLTGADTVIHFDPWWNPAVEDQATDRAHRIGQTRLVTSYKLITRGTVEEKIVQLQQRKRAIIQSIMGGEEQFVEALTWDEIQELFAE
jgi:superfamily II DNA or RNA helicase